MKHEFAPEKVDAKEFGGLYYGIHSELVDDVVALGFCEFSAEEADRVLEVCIRNSC